MTSRSVHKCQLAGTTPFRESLATAIIRSAKHHFQDIHINMIARHPIPAAPIHLVFNQSERGQSYSRQNLVYILLHQNLSVSIDYANEDYRQLILQRCMIIYTVIRFLVIFSTKTICGL